MNEVDEYLAELSALTGMSAPEWRDFLSCSPDAQAVIVQGYRDQDWTRSPDTFAKVLSILEVVGAIAGVVTTVAGVPGALSALRGL